MQKSLGDVISYPFPYFVHYHILCLCHAGGTALNILRLWPGLFTIWSPSFWTLVMDEQMGSLMNICFEGLFPFGWRRHLCSCAVYLLQLAITLAEGKGGSPHGQLEVAVLKLVDLQERLVSSSMLRQWTQPSERSSVRCFLTLSRRLKT